MQVKRAELSDLEALLPLYCAYRDFYKQNPAGEEARQFLKENISKNRSIIFVATNGDGEMVGFTQLYPTFSSLFMKPTLYLSDLYVDQSQRRGGVARLLMQQAKQFALDSGAVSIDLQTAHTNTSAQSLYESEGYKLDEEFRTYFLKIV